jgi:NAD-dependent dihydropyrimidine dehydrogenase PreA subunit
MGENPTSAAEYFLRIEDLAALLSALTQSGRVIAPLRSDWGEVFFEPIASGEQPTFDFENAVVSPKDFLLPQTEVLALYRRVGKTYEVEAPIDAQPQVIAGIRSCDLRAMQILDEAVGSGEYPDPYYVARREKTTFISLACSTVFEKHFCPPLETGPTLESGFDLHLTAVEGGFTAQVGSVAGQRLVGEHGRFFKAAGPSYVEQRIRAAQNAVAGFAARFDIQAVQRTLSSGEDVEILADAAKRCQECGGCLFACPTCTCFDVRDYPTGEGTGERVRTWDTCAFAGFTRMAGGANPSGSKDARSRRRLMHKLVYRLESEGLLGCVGCGRCIDVCLGNIDIVDLLERLSGTEGARVG